MSKKLGNKQLLVILLALVGVYFIYRYISNKRGENTFNTAIIPKIDTAKITEMLIYTDVKKGEPMRFTKKGNRWLVTQGGYTTLADLRSEKFVVDQLKQIAPERLATNDPAQWKDFTVMDTNGTRLILLNDKDTVINLIVGKFGFNMQQKQGISYVRIHGQKEVYGVQGFLSMNITENVDSWRDRSLIYMNPGQYGKITYTYPADSSFSVIKDSLNKWHFADGGKTDTIAVPAIIGAMSQQNYGTFVYKFDTNSVKPLCSLMLEGSGLNPLIIKAYVSDTANKYVLTSSMNPGAYFSSKNGAFGKLFLGKAAFTHHTVAKNPATPAPKGKK